MADDFIRIGKIAGIHGVKGYVTVYPTTDFPERFEKGKEICINLNSRNRIFEIEDCILKKKQSFLLKLKGINDQLFAERLKGGEIFISRAEAEKTRSVLSEDTFYYYDLIDCEVFLSSGQKIGFISSIEKGAGDLLVIKTDKEKEIFVPFIEEMVDVSSIKEKKITIEPIDGLLEIQDN